MSALDLILINVPVMDRSELVAMSLCESQPIVGQSAELEVIRFQLEAAKRAHHVMNVQTFMTWIFFLL